MWKLVACLCVRDGGAARSLSLLHGLLRPTHIAHIMSTWNKVQYLNMPFIVDSQDQAVLIFV